MSPKIIRALSSKSTNAVRDSTQSSRDSGGIYGAIITGIASPGNRAASASNSRRALRTARDSPVGVTLHASVLFRPRTRTCTTNSDCRLKSGVILSSIPLISIVETWRRTAVRASFAWIPNSLLVAMVFIGCLLRVWPGPRERLGRGHEPDGLRENKYQVVLRLFILLQCRRIIPQQIVPLVIGGASWSSVQRNAIGVELFQALNRSSAGSFPAFRCRLTSLTFR